MYKAMLVAGMLSFILLASACGGGGGSAATVTLEGKDDFSFTPKTISATAGQPVTVKLKNAGVLEHTFTIDELNVDMRVAGGKEGTVTFTPAGSRTLAFYCAIAGHREGGMEGKLTAQ